MKQNWLEHLEPLMAQYHHRKHPLDYKSRYQLLVMVILSAQDSDKPRPRGYITIPYLHKSTGWSVGFISNPTSLYS